MKLVLALYVLVFSLAAAFAVPAVASGPKTDVKCRCVSCCMNGPPKAAPVVPVDTGKGSCKAHPASCK